jgi:hypothetical protein
MLLAVHNREPGAVGRFGELAGQEVEGDQRVLAGAGGRQAEEHCQVQRVRGDGQGFVEDPVAADAVDAGAAPLQVPVEVTLVTR